MSKAFKDNQMQTCPQCDNHCPADALQCGKGRKYFGAEDTGHEHGHGCRRHRDGLGGLLQRCGRFVRHSELENAELFQALTDEEKAALQVTLEKLTADWKTRWGEEGSDRGHHHGRDGEGRRHKHGAAANEQPEL